MDETTLENNSNTNNFTNKQKNIKNKLKKYITNKHNNIKNKLKNYQKNMSLQTNCTAQQMQNIFYQYTNISILWFVLIKQCPHPHTFYQQTLQFISSLFTLNYKVYITVYCTEHTKSHTAINFPEMIKGFSHLDWSCQLNCLGCKSISQSRNKTTIYIFVFFDKIENVSHRNVFKIV